MAKMKEEVRDGCLQDLPDELQTKVMMIHKIIVDKCRDEFRLPQYNSINKQGWAKTWLDKFLVTPTPTGSVGSVRVYKKGKRYRCIIQITDHVDNQRNTEDEELFHGMLRNVSVSIKSKVRRKFDCTVLCLSEHGEPYEGYGLLTKQKIAKEIWEIFDDKNTKGITAMKESYINRFKNSMSVALESAPAGLVNVINSVVETAKDNGVKFESVGDIILDMSNGICEGYIGLSFNDKDGDKARKFAENTYEVFERMNPGKFMGMEESSIVIGFDHEYSKLLHNYFENHTDHIDKDVSFTEAAESNTAKSQLRQMAKIMMNNSNHPGFKVTQSLANTYASIITREMLPSIGNGFNKLTISIDDTTSSKLEFRIPAITQDFVSRFINGREGVNGLLHRTPEIKIKVSADLFKTIRNPDDLYYFFTNAIKFYTVGIDKYMEKLQSSYIKYGIEMKELLSNKLHSVVAASIQMMFGFDHLDMSDRKAFTISNDEIKAMVDFISSIYVKYEYPEKKKKEILADLKDIVVRYSESFDDIQFRSLCTDLTKFMEGAYDSMLESYKERFYDSNVDKKWMTESTNPDIKYYQEKFGVKKLKKIPKDLVAYITIETECIKDANDKMMIASYCLSKIEIVEWYIELLDVGSKKYIVPHTKPYLETIRTQLLACYKKIMETKINNDQNRPIIDIKYPAGYEG